VFEDWKKAWQEAVDNFRRELEEDDGATDPAHLSSMRRDLNDAKKALDRLQLDLQRTRTELGEEEKQEQICRRRGELATGIDDHETVRIAIEWAERHHQRVLILKQKADALEAELGMRTEDLANMETQFEQTRVELGSPPISAATAADRVPTPEQDAERRKQDAEFRRLEREAREKAAEARLEELKKKMH